MPTNKLKLGTYIFTTLCLMVIIFAFSSQNAADSQQLSDGLLFRILSILHVPEFMDAYGTLIRKLAHFALYFALGASSLLMFLQLKTKASPQMSAWLFSTLYAVSDEIHQYFVPGRSMQLSDMLLDSSGALTAILIISAIRIIAFKYREEPKENEQTSSTEKE